MKKNRESSHTVWSFLANGSELSRYRLNFIIAIETIVLIILWVIINPHTHHPALVTLIGVGIGLAIIDLLALKKYQNVNFSGYFITSLVFVVSLLGNLMIGGPTTSFFIWIFITPIIAAILTSLTGLLIFGALTTISVFLYSWILPTPIFLPTASFNGVIALINYTSFMVLTLTILTTFIVGISTFQKKLLDQQRALESDRERFHYLSHHDLLTKLPNRSYFYGSIEKKMKELTKNQELILFYMDLDNFKLVNDEYGHDVGDLVLKETARRLSNCFRLNDFLGRMGGDEFTAFIVHNKDDGFPKMVKQRIRAAFSHHFRESISHIKLSISIGTASYPAEAQNTEELFKLADQRMYKDKKKNKQDFSQLQ